MYIQPSQTNYRIAEDFIMSNLHGHTFPDTNDNDIKRNYAALMEKFLIHNQKEKVLRLDYLKEEFLKHKLKSIGGGYGEVHYSVMRMLLLLSTNPTNLEDEDLQDLNAQHKKYYTQKELQEMEDQRLMTEMKQVQTQEDLNIQQIEAEWLEALEENDSQSDHSSLNQSFDDLEPDHNINNQVAAPSQVQNNINEQESTTVRWVTSQQPHQQMESRMFFGGIPTGSLKAPPMIKTQYTNTRKIVKKFNINQFLDKYLTELQPPKLPYDNFLERKAMEKVVQDKEDQEELKDVLGIRTFDNLQKELSHRCVKLAQPRGSITASNINPQKSSYQEPLNTLKDTQSERYNGQGYWNFKTITERQMAIDSIMALQILETNSYKIGDIGGRKAFQIREAQQMSHLTPEMVQCIGQRICQMANIVRDTHLYLQSLDSQQGSLGTVIESFIFHSRQIMLRFETELTDLQQIALLQAGQISLKQINLSTNQMSQVSLITQLDTPLTMSRIMHLLDTALFNKVKLVHQVMRNGIMDFLIIDEDQNFGDLLLVQEVNGSMMMDNSFRQDQAKLNGLPPIQTEKIRNADRVTFLLNYMYLVIRNNQLLKDFQEIDLLKELYLACVQPYIAKISDWVSKGELKDPTQEFFLRANPKLESQNNQNVPKSKEWKESFIFRTVNLRELLGMGQGLFPVENPKVEISIPIFLRPVMEEILSIGKSIKILRFFDRQGSHNQENYQDFQEFKEIYRNKVSKEVNITQPESDKFEYFDTAKNLPNKELQKIADQHLVNIWDPSYSFGNIMNDSVQVRNYRDLLNIAPFQWSLEQSNQDSIFQLPSVQRNMNISFASTQLSDQNTPEKQRLPIDYDQVMIEESPLINDKPPKAKLPLVMNDENYAKLVSQSNYSKQELNGYQDSINYYQAYQAFDYFMQDKIIDDGPPLYKKIQFTNDSIENFIKETILLPIKQIFKKTCDRFVKRLDLECKVQHTLKMLRQIYFMEAGHQMHQFSTQLFKHLDKGKSCDNLYLLNGHFNDHLCSQIAGATFFEKLRIVFSSDPQLSKTTSVNALDYISITYQAEWPLEIILDQDSIAKYNSILQQLMRIKRVNYLVSLKDYWIKPQNPNLKPYSEMNVREQIMEKNRQMLDSTIHQMQIFQKELLHFTQNLEYYLKTRAIQQVCNDLDIQLKDIQSDQEFIVESASHIDMDSFIEIHQEFLGAIMKLCLLDAKQKQLLDVVNKMLQIGLDFRMLCLKFLIRPDTKDKIVDQDSDSDEIGINLSDDGKNDETKVKGYYGMGLLRTDSIKFVDKIDECQLELDNMKQLFSGYMKLLIQNLKQSSRRGVYSYLDEAFIRFNFNSYYMSRDREGLE